MVTATLQSYAGEPFCYDPAFEMCMTEQELAVCNGQYRLPPCHWHRYGLRLGKLGLWCSIVMLEARLLFRKQQDDCTLPAFLPLTQVMHRVFRLIFALSELVLGFPARLRFHVSGSRRMWTNPGLCMFGATASFLTVESCGHVLFGVISGCSLALLSRRSMGTPTLAGGGTLCSNAFWAVFMVLPSFYLIYDVKHECAGSRISNAGNEFLTFSTLVAATLELALTKQRVPPETADSAREWQREAWHSSITVMSDLSNAPRESATEFRECSSHPVLARPPVCLTSFEYWVDYHQAALLTYAAVTFILQILLLDDRDCWLYRGAPRDRRLWPRWRRVFLRFIVPYVLNVLGAVVLFAFLEFRERRGLQAVAAVCQQVHDEGCDSDDKEVAKAARAAQKRASLAEQVHGQVAVLEVEVVRARGLPLPLAAAAGLRCQCSIPGRPLVSFTTPEAPPGSADPVWLHNLQITDFAPADVVRFEVSASALSRPVWKAELPVGEFDGELPLYDDGGAQQGWVQVRLELSTRHVTRSFQRRVRQLGRRLHFEVPASKWCVTKHDLKDFRRRVRRAVSVGTIPNESKHANHEDPSIGPSIYDVVKHFIKVETLQADCSWALMTNPEGLDCDIFVTHAWSEGVFEFVEKVLRAWPTGAQNLWCCFLANPQNGDVAEILGSDVRQSPFAQALREAKYMIVVPNKQASIYKRLWCVYEAMLGMEKARQYEDCFEIFLPAALPSERIVVVAGDAVAWGVAAVAYSAVLRIWHHWSKWDLPLLMSGGKKTILNATYFEGINWTYLLTWTPFSYLVFMILLDAEYEEGLAGFVCRQSLPWRRRCSEVFGFGCLDRCTSRELRESRAMHIKKRGRAKMVAVGLLAGILVGDNLTHPLWERVEKVARWSFAVSLLAMGCKYVVRGIYDAMVKAEAAELEFTTVREAECFSESDKALIRKAIEGKEDTIDSMIRTIRYAGQYNKDVRMAVQLGMDARQHRFDIIQWLSTSLMCMYLAINSERQANEERPNEVVDTTTAFAVLAVLYPTLVIALHAIGYGPRRWSLMQTKAQRISNWLWNCVAAFTIVTTLVGRLTWGTSYWAAVWRFFWVLLVVAALPVAFPYTAERARQAINAQLWQRRHGRRCAPPPAAGAAPEPRRSGSGRASGGAAALPPCGVAGSQVELLRVSETSRDSQTQSGAPAGR